ncbi:MAG TPA: T9SS type A sorting domain-containing protein [Brumimicrobium sp.]|nr:T9SS type A sorting domain-containing protein [Brumimicrobium sp.]
MKKINSFIAFLLISCAVSSQNLISVTPMDSHSLAAVEANINPSLQPDNADLHALKSYKVVYNTTDVHGNPTIASGALYLPVLTDCAYVPILVYEHSTEFRKAIVPSTNNYIIEAGYFSTTGYITILPDYLGLGVNPGVHIYQHAETEATATLDLIRAVREFLENAPDELKDNGELFITGYSHGGHSAMATNKYIEDHNLHSEFNVVACAPLSGAYDQSGAQFDLMFDNDSTFYATPLIPYILASYQEAYGNLYQSYEELYKPSHASQIEAFINSGTNDVTQWTDMLGTNYFVFMQDSVLHNMFADVNRDSHPINVALKANNLYDWVPTNPMRMVYCGNDTMVSPYNTINTLDTMLALGATQVEAVLLSQLGDHHTCYWPAKKYALDWFNTLATKCTYVSIDEFDKELVTLYPNPTKDILMVKGVELSNSNVTIHSSLGRLFENRSIINNQIDVTELPPGIYFITIANKDKEVVLRMKFVKE